MNRCCEMPAWRLLAGQRRETPRIQCKQCGWIVQTVDEFLLGVEAGWILPASDESSAPIAAEVTAPPKPLRHRCYLPSDSTNSTVRA